MLHSRIALIIPFLVALATSADAALVKVDAFGANPGALVMYEHVPAGLPAGRPIVVVMHGCTQTAAAMETAGWNELADQHRFTVIYPEQQTANNPARCFNWAGEYGDTANLERGKGENASIIAMVDSAIARHGADRTKVYVAGFSAGGAFAAVLAATHPDRFAAVSIMSGLPYRCATSVSGAFSCQSPGVDKTPAAWGDLVRAAFTTTGARPRVQIWHGASDATVVPANQVELVEQWSNALGATPGATETIGGTTRSTFVVGQTVVLESYRVGGMGHAVATGSDPLGTCTATAGAYFEARSICSTLRAARFFDLIGGGGGGGGSDAAPPSVAIVSPADGATVSGTLTVVVAASDETAMGDVALAIDGIELGVDAEAPYQFDWDATAAGDGDHELVATARDAAGNTVAATARVTVASTGGGGGGGGAGTGGGDDDGDGPSDELPACSLDAGRGGAGLATIALALALVLRRRQR